MVVVSTDLRVLLRVILGSGSELWCCYSLVYVRISYCRSKSCRLRVTDWRGASPGVRGGSQLEGQTKVMKSFDVLDLGKSMVPM